MDTDSERIRLGGIELLDVAVFDLKQIGTENGKSTNRKDYTKAAKKLQKVGRKNKNKKNIDDIVCIARV